MPPVDSRKIAATVAGSVVWSPVLGSVDVGPHWPFPIVSQSQQSMSSVHVVVGVTLVVELVLELDVVVERATVVLVVLVVVVLVVVVASVVGAVVGGAVVGGTVDVHVESSQ